MGKASKPRRAAAILVFGLALVWAFSRISSNGAGELSDDIMAEDLRRTVGALVEEIEAFRAEEGRLPEEAELIAEELIGPEIDDQMEYTVTADGYVIRLSEDSLVAEYDGSVPLDRWVAGIEN